MVTLMVSRHLTLSPLSPGLLAARDAAANRGNGGGPDCRASLVNSIRRRLRRGSFQHGRNHLTVTPAALRLSSCPLLKHRMTGRVHVPPRSIGRPQSRRPIEPAKRVELVADGGDILPAKFPHSAIAALNVAVGDVVEVMGENVARNRRQPFMVVGEPERAGIECRRM